MDHADTVAAASTLQVIGELGQLAGFVYGVEVGLNDRILAGECMRLMEDLLSPADLAQFRAHRDAIRASVDGVREALS